MHGFTRREKSKKLHSISHFSAFSETKLNPTILPNRYSLEEIERHSKVYESIHGLALNAILVFTQIAAGRSDNSAISTSPSPSPSGANPRPDIQLFVFSICFLIYLVLKGWEKALTDVWFGLNKFLDKVSILVATISIAVLLSLLTTLFTFWVVVPTVVAMVVGRVVLGLWGFRLLECFYIAFLGLKKRLEYFGLYCCWLITYFKVRISSNPSQAILDSFDDAVRDMTESPNFWSVRIRVVRLRATAYHNATKAGKATARVLLRQMDLQLDSLGKRKKNL